MGVKIHELDLYGFESPLCQQLSLHPGQGFVCVVIGHFYQGQLIPLVLIQTGLHAEGLL
jgi:hypothetical protein